MVYLLFSKARGLRLLFKKQIHLTIFQHGFYPLIYVI